MPISQGYGFSDLARGVEADPDTLWQAGSTTKAFTSAALSLLVDTNALSWSSTVRSILGDDFAVEAEWPSHHLTIDDAVSHRSGLPRHDYVYHSNMSTTQMIRGLRHLPLTAEPRTTFQYCNLMFTTLGVIIETLSRQSLVQYLQEKLWTPLGMHSTFLSRASASETGGSRLATGYHWNDITKDYIPASTTPIDTVGGAGAIVSTVADYAKWVRMFLRRAHPLFRLKATPRCSNRAQSWAMRRRRAMFRPTASTLLDGSSPRIGANG